MVDAYPVEFLVKHFLWHVSEQPRRARISITDASDCSFEVAPKANDLNFRPLRGDTAIDLCTLSSWNVT